MSSPQVQWDDVQWDDQPSPAPNAGLAPAAGGTPPLALNPNFKYNPELRGSGEIGGGPDIRTSLYDAALGPAMGTASALPIVTAGASIPVQSAIMGLSGAAQSKLQGGSNKEAALSGALGAGMGALPAIFPSTLKEKAGTLLRQFTKANASAIVNPSVPGQVALEAHDLASAGGQLPKVIRNFLQRVSAPEAPPLTLKEARLFVQNASRQSASEYGNMTEAMQRLVGKFAGALHSAIGEASGQPEQYSDLIRNYANSRTYGTAVDKAKGLLLKALAAAGVGAAGYKGYQSIKR